MRSGRWILSITMSAVLVAQTAQADPRARPTAASDRALDLFERSAKAYREGRFQDAVDLLLEARRVKAEPVLLYNLGRAYEALGDYAKAADAFEAYLGEDPRAADRRAIEARIAILHGQANQLDKARAAPADPKPMPVAPPPPPEPAPAVAPWIVSGVGVVGIGVGVGLGLSANGHHRDAVAAPDQVSAQSDQDSAKTLATGSTIAFIAGGIAAAAGITWLTIKLTSQPVQVTTGLGNVVVGGTF